jgi:hypothetical protein
MEPFGALPRKDKDPPDKQVPDNPPTAPLSHDDFSESQLSSFSDGWLSDMFDQDLSLDAESGVSVNAHPQPPLSEEVSGARRMPTAVIGPPVVGLALASQIGPSVRPPTHGSVKERFMAIIGSEIRQKELMSLRRGLFADILPPMRREEARTLSANLMGLNRRREIVLARLSNPIYVWAVLDEVLRFRTTPRDRESVLKHAKRFHRI